MLFIINILLYMGKKSKQTKEKLQNQKTSAENQQPINQEQKTLQSFSQIHPRYSKKSHNLNNKNIKSNVNEQGQIKTRNIKRQDQDKKSSGILWSQVAQHDHSHNLWVVIKDNVYNLTKIADSHPGGKKVLTQRAGKDATSSFESGNHPESVIEKKLPKYLVGKLQLDSIKQGWQSQQKQGGFDCLMTILLSFGILSFMVSLI